MSSAAPASQLCAYCKRDARLCCKRCKDIPDAAEGRFLSTWYYGSECQKADWTNHKAVCSAAQDGRVLYRTGEIAQSLYYIFNRNTYMWTIERVEKADQIWFVFDAAYSGKSIVIDFPVALFPDAKDQEAMLSHLGCNRAVEVMHDLFKIMLQDILKEVDEVTVKIKNAQLQIVRVYGPDDIDTTTYIHNVLRITLKNEEVFALDMTGAQYGWSGSVMSWLSFSAFRMESIELLREFGGTAQFNKPTALRIGAGRIASRKVDQENMEGFYYYIAEWHLKDISLNALLRLPEEEFRPKRASFLDFMEKSMESFRVFALENGCFNKNHGKD